MNDIVYEIELDGKHTIMHKNIGSPVVGDQILIDIDGSFQRLKVVNRCWEPAAQCNMVHCILNCVVVR